ncbi:hypothetical protein D3C73_1552390 [compost metagenome]
MAILQPPVLVTVADIRTAGLEIQQIRSRVRLAEGVPAGHPGLHIILLVRLERHIAAADRNDAVGQLQQLQDMLGVGQDLLQHLLRSFRVILA